MSHTLNDAISWVDMSMIIIIVQAAVQAAVQVTHLVTFLLSASELILHSKKADFQVFNIPSHKGHSGKI